MKISWNQAQPVKLYLEEIFFYDGILNLFLISNIINFCPPLNNKMFSVKHKLQVRF